MYSKYVLIAALLYLLLAFLRFAAALIPSKWRNNPAPPLGKKWPAVGYSFTGAMSPTKKESAYMHLPTYTAGMIFHVGLLSAILYLLIMLIGIKLPVWLGTTFTILFLCGSLCGLTILIKRIFNPLLRSISNPDDFISNILVTFFQVFSAAAAYNSKLLDALFIYSFILILYIPIGKLRHSFYFFSSRIALGFYYGSRGVWSKKSNLQ